MADITDPATRSKMMASVRSSNTGPELAFRRALWRVGLRGYRIHRRDIPGSPDIAWVGKRVAVFIDGAFWHGHPSAFTLGKSGEFWDRKITANMERDRRVERELRKQGWKVIRIWDFEIQKDLPKCLSRVELALRASS